MGPKNTNLILTCGFLELVVLGTVKGRKIHIPVRTPKAGECQVQYTGTVTRTCGEREHVSRLCELVFALDLSFHSVAGGLATLYSQRWILVNLCTRQIEASTSPPRATPGHLYFVQNFYSNSPLPRPKSCSNAPS